MPPSPLSRKAFDPRRPTDLESSARQDRAVGWLTRGSLVSCALTLLACQGTIGGGSEPPPPVRPAEELGVAPSGLRRLTTAEYDATVMDIFGDATRPASGQLPEDALTPFDNDFLTQDPSAVLVQAAETLAIDVAQRLVADPARRDDVVGCVPSAASDRTCMRAFVERVGRRAYRRTLASAEIDDLVELGDAFATKESDFYEGVDVIVRALLQAPQFLYRVELGAPVENQAGLFRLGAFELATRLSYLVVGSTPDDELLAVAESGEIASPEERIAQVNRLLATPRARAQADRFHAMWLGYSRMALEPELASRMRRETAALIDRVVFEEKGPWLRVFQVEESFVDDTLATHYGLVPPGSNDPTWVSLAGSGRRGILSQGAFLSAASNPGDTSPTKRGLLIRNRLLCSPVPPPPPDVPADTPPDSSVADCKWDQYAAHREKSSCANCHSQMDPIGFGLENYDKEGRFREHDDGRPECLISGDGELVGAATFNGPAELSDVLVATGSLEGCATRHFMQYAVGGALTPNHDALVEEVTAAFLASGGEFGALMAAFVGAEAFAYRLAVSEKD
jgi:hypothetical protein